MGSLAVLTGDIVHSQRLAPGELDRVFSSLAHHADLLGDGTGQAAYFTRGRGDGWQIATTPRFALRAVFLMRAAVRACGKGYETRLGLGVGMGNVPGPSLANADGPAFVASGQALDSMKKVRRIAAVDASAAITSALPLAEVVSGRWTPRQAEVAAQALGLPEKSRGDMAQALQLSQQAFQTHWAAAGLVAVLDACAIAEGQDT